MFRILKPPKNVPANKYHLKVQHLCVSGKGTVQLLNSLFRPLSAFLSCRKVENPWYIISDDND